MLTGGGGGNEFIAWNGNRFVAWPETAGGAYERFGIQSSAPLSDTQWAVDTNIGELLSAPQYSGPNPNSEGILPWRSDATAICWKPPAEERVILKHDSTVQRLRPMSSRIPR
jgi:hypothetical protein